MSKSSLSLDYLKRSKNIKDQSKWNKNKTLESSKSRNSSISCSTGDGDDGGYSGDGDTNQKVMINNNKKIQLEPLYCMSKFPYILLYLSIPYYVVYLITLIIWMMMISGDDHHHGGRNSCTTIISIATIWCVLNLLNNSTMILLLIGINRTKTTMMMIMNDNGKVKKKQSKVMIKQTIIGPLEITNVSVIRYSTIVSVSIWFNLTLLALIELPLYVYIYAVWQTSPPPSSPSSSTATTVMNCDYHLIITLYCSTFIQLYQCFLLFSNGITCWLLYDVLMIGGGGYNYQVLKWLKSSKQSENDDDDDDEDSTTTTTLILPTFEKSIVQLENEVKNFLKLHIQTYSSDVATSTNERNRGEEKTTAAKTAAKSHVLPSSSG